MTNTTFALYQDVVKRIESGELANSFIAPILQKECQHPDRIETSEQYDWEEFKKEVEWIDDLEQKVDEVANDKLLANDVAVLSASIAIPVAGAMKKSTEALNYLSRICGAVFAAFNIRLDLSRIEQYDLYRNAYDAAHGAEEFRDDVLAVLKCAANRD